MSQALKARTPVWFILAAVVGLLAGTQPPAVSFAVLALSAFTLFGLVTPMSTLAILMILAPMRTLIEIGSTAHISTRHRSIDTDSDGQFLADLFAYKATNSSTTGLVASLYPGYPVFGRNGYHFF